MKWNARNQRTEWAAGGVARVFRVETKNGYLAEKILLPQFQTLMEFENLQSREFEILSKLNHLQIPKAEQLRQERTRSGLPTHVIELEWIEGLPLSDLLKQLEAWSGEERLGFGLYFLTEACTVLGYVFGKSLIHGDLSPDNFILQQNGRVVLIDFGGALFEDEDSASASRVQLAGKRSYRAPEFRDRAGGSKDADIYSLGRIFEALVGEAQHAKVRHLISAMLEDRVLPSLVDLGSSSFVSEKIIWSSAPPPQNRETTQTMPVFSLPRFRFGLLLFFVWLSMSTFQVVGVLQVNALPQMKFCLNEGSDCAYVTPAARLVLPQGLQDIEFVSPQNPKMRFQRSVRVKSSRSLKFFEDFRNADNL